MFGSYHGEHDRVAKSCVVRVIEDLRSVGDDVVDGHWRKIGVRSVPVITNRDSMVVEQKVQYIH